MTRSEDAAQKVYDEAMDAAELAFEKATSDAETAFSKAIAAALRAYYRHCEESRGVARNEAKRSSTAAPAARRKPDKIKERVIKLTPINGDT